MRAILRRMRDAVVEPEPRTPRWYEETLHLVLAQNLAKQRELEDVERVLTGREPKTQTGWKIYAILDRTKRAERSLVRLRRLVPAIFHSNRIGPNGRQEPWP